MLVASNTNIPIREPVTIPEISIADAKVQKIALAFFGVVSFFVANSLLACGGLIGSLSLVFYLLTLTFAVRFFKVKDYENPAKLKIYRTEAKEQTFEEVIRAHGLVRTLKHDILAHSAFQEKLGLYLDTLSPTLLAKLYLQLVDATEELNLNLGNYRKIFIKSLNLPSREKPSILFEKEDMPLLLRTGLLAKELASSYQDFLRLKEVRKENETYLREVFAKGYLEIIQKFEADLQTATSTSKEARRWIASLKKDIAYLKKHPIPSNTTFQLPIWQIPPKKWEDLSGLIAHHSIFTEVANTTSFEFSKTMSQEGSQFEKEVAAIDKKFGA